MAEQTKEQVVYAALQEALQELGSEPDQLKPEATFQELGLDSLDLVELAQIVEERFGVTVKGSEVAKIGTLGEAASWIAAQT